MYLTFPRSDNAILPLLLTSAKKFGKDGNSKASQNPEKLSIEQISSAF